MQMALCALKFKLSESLCKVFSNSEIFLKDRNIYNGCTFAQMLGGQVERNLVKYYK